MAANDMVETIKKSMPRGLTKLEIARYIYIELGKQRRFDLTYYFGDSESRKRMRRLARDAKNNPKKYHNKKSIICVSLTYLYKSILEEYGIECEVIRIEKNYTGHVIPVLQINDEKRGKLRIVADLQRDLPWIQAGLMTNNFGVNDPLVGRCTELFYEDLRDIDKKIGYISDEYKDVDIDVLKQKIRDYDVHAGLRTVLTDPRITGKNSFQGHNEVKQYYANMIRTLLGRFNKKKAFLVTCYRDKPHDESDEIVRREYTLCAFSYDKRECYPYLYSIREKRFIAVSLDKLIELQDKGLIIGTKTFDGSELLKKVLQERREKKPQQNESDSRQ